MGELFQHGQPAPAPAAVPAGEMLSPSYESRQDQTRVTCVLFVITCGRVTVVKVLCVIVVVLVFVSAI